MLYIVSLKVETKLFFQINEYIVVQMYFPMVVEKKIGTVGKIVRDNRACKIGAKADNWMVQGLGLHDHPIHARERCNINKTESLFNS